VASSPWSSAERIAWEPPEDLTVSAWADKYRVLTFRAAKSGQWETSFNPVMRRIMDSFSMSCVQEIWIQKPAQSGGTDSQLNMLGWAISEDPATTLIVEPNEDLAVELSTDRIDDMIAHCDKLGDLVRNNRDDLLSKKKTFSTMTVYFGWAGSAISLASRTVRYVFFDEVNKYGKWTGEEASPLALGLERTATFEDMAVIVYASTPTTENGYITKGETDCDARFRYKIACPECGHKQVLDLSGVKFGADHSPKAVEESAWYACIECGGVIDESMRTELVRRGDWYELESELPYMEHVERHRPRSVGFQFNRLYTPWFSFGKYAAEFLRCKDIPEKLMNFKNSWEGVAWAEKAESKSIHQLEKNVIDLPALVCPSNTVGLTCGIDPGQGGYWFAVVAWSLPMTPHVIHCGFFTTEQEPFSLIHENAYLIEGTKQESISIWRAGMDSGGSKYESDDFTMTERAYMWIRQYGGGKVYATKGMSTKSTGKKIKEYPLDKTPKGKPMPHGTKLWHLDTDAFKNAIHMRLGLSADQPGRLTFHMGIKQDIFSHIAAEEKIKNRKGEFEWVRKGANHLLDCLVIAFAMADPEAGGGVSVRRRPGAVVQKGRRLLSGGVQL
jgi:phage terminase large subunit GpA-like protein